ncbi:MAG: thioredoxin domain-containing protein, partial [Polyangiales bacterium]
MQKLTTDTYPEFIAAGTRIAVVTAAWAGHSRMFVPVIEEVAKELPLDAHVGLIDSDSEPELTDALTKAVPSTHVFIDGQPARSIIGAMSADELRTELIDAGVRFARDSVVKRARARGTGRRLALTQDFVARAEIAARADRETLAAYIRRSSWVATYGERAQIEASVERALEAIRELPALISEVEAAALDEGRRPVYRLGALAGLLYGAATFDLLADLLPAGYGYLDDWLVLTASKWIYVQLPESAEAEQLADTSRLIWNCLPPQVIAPLAEYVGFMEHERAMLEQLPDHEVDAMLSANLKRPAPMQFVVPAAQAATPLRDPLGGW